MALEQTEVTIVRIYLSEKEAHVNKLVELLKEYEHLRGVTVFRGVSGYGDSGKIHTSSLLDLSLNLPVIVEFFDSPQKIKQVMQHLIELEQPGHIVSWNAHINHIQAN